MTKTTINYRITIDHNRHTIDFRDMSCKIPYSKIYDDSPECFAAICRDAAHYFLEMAYNAETANDFTPSFFGEEQREQQIVKMKRAHVFTDIEITPICEFAE